LTDLLSRYEHLSSQLLERFGDVEEDKGRETSCNSDSIIDFDDKNVSIRSFNEAGMTDSFYTALKSIPETTRTRVIFCVRDFNRVFGVESMKGRYFNNWDIRLIDILGDTFEVEPSFFKQVVDCPRPPEEAGELPDSELIDPLIEGKVLSSSMTLRFDFQDVTLEPENRMAMTTYNRAPSFCITLKPRSTSRACSVSMYYLTSPE